MGQRSTLTRPHVGLLVLVGARPLVHLRSPGVASITWLMQPSAGGYASSASYTWPRRPKLVAPEPVHDVQVIVQCLWRRVDMGVALADGALEPGHSLAPFGLIESRNFGHSS